MLLIDDFLATGKTIDALAALVAQCGATLCGIGCLIEKTFEGRRAQLAHLHVPIITLAVIESMSGDETMPTLLSAYVGGRFDQPTLANFFHGPMIAHGAATVGQPLTL